MSEDEKERLLAECLEEYHRRRALREVVSAEDFHQKLGELFEEFCDLLAAELSLDEVIEPEVPAEAFPRPFGLSRSGSSGFPPGRTRRGWIN